MKKTSPITATVIFGAGAALLAAGALSLPLRLSPRPTALNALLFLCLAAYAALLARLSAKPIRSFFAPLLMLAAVLPVAASVGGFVVPAAAGLAWMRSGICFPGPAARRAAAEALAAAAGLAVCAALRPPGAAGWALSLWLFFLVQALYFVIIDPHRRSRGEAPARDPLQTAHLRAQALLREQTLERAFAELDLSTHPGSDT
jgi:hypothetical protein